MTNTMEIMRRINVTAADLEGTIRSFEITDKFVTVGGVEYALADFINIAVIHHSDVNNDVRIPVEYAYTKIKRRLFGNEKSSPIAVLRIMRKIMKEIMRTYA